MPWPLLSRRRPLARIAFNMRPVPGPWGGSSVFVGQMEAYLRRRGYAVQYDLQPPADVIVLVDPREDNRYKRFGPGRIAAYRAAHPEVRVLHRVNECDQRKGTDFMDRLLTEANLLADYTVFISAWLRDYHAARWFDTRRPHEPIYNGADPALFHPLGSEPYGGTGPLRIVTHHWSANPLKGFDVYQRLDEWLAQAGTREFEFWVVGRWPETITWRAARVFPPAHGRALADRLRQAHLYLTASRWEPCGFHHVEGAQCGLPLVYHEDGGGIVEAGQRYGVGFRDDPVPALQEARARYRELRARVLADPPDGERMCWQYERVIRSLLMSRG